jgi:hypothetical protein
MNIKARIVHGLVRLYPARWRAEYGEEIEALLAARELTPFAALDVIRSAAREHLRRAEFWKISGMALFGGTACTIYVNNSTRLPRLSYFWFPFTWNVVLIVIGCVTSLRARGRSPSWAAAKAAMLGYLPELAAFALWMAGIFHPLVIQANGPYHLLESRLALYAVSFPTVPRPTSGVIQCATTILFL